MNPASLAIEVGKTAMGKESTTQLVCWIFIAVTIDALLKQELNDMQLIYMPEGCSVTVFIILIAFAFIAPLMVGLFFKNESHHADEPWTHLYISTLLIDMVATPCLGLIAQSLIVQAWFPDIDPTAYMVLLPVVLLIVAYFTLKVLNEGLKATYEQIKGVAKEVQEIADDAQKTFPVEEAPKEEPKAEPEVKTVEKIVYVTVPATNTQITSSVPATQEPVTYVAAQEVPVQPVEAPAPVETVNGIQKI